MTSLSDQLLRVVPGNPLGPQQSQLLGEPQRGQLEEDSSIYGEPLWGHGRGMVPLQMTRQAQPGYKRVRTKAT